MAVPRLPSQSYSVVGSLGKTPYSRFCGPPRGVDLTANIGLHHIHHLSARIPNYNLQRAHDQNPIFHQVPTLSLWDGLRAVRFKLWDEDRRRSVTFAEARKRSAAAADW